MKIIISKSTALMLRNICAHIVHNNVTKDTKGNLNIDPEKMKKTGFTEHEVNDVAALFAQISKKLNIKKTSKNG